MNIPEMQSDDLCNDLCIGGGTGGGRCKGVSSPPKFGQGGVPPYFLSTHVTTDQFN